MNNVFIYIGLNALIMVMLAMNVIRERGKNKVSLGDGGFNSLNKAIRAHGNNTEYTPIGLLILIGLGLKDAPMAQLHMMGISLTLGRLFHGLGLAASFPYGRMIGIVLTFLSIISGAILLMI